MTTDVPAGRPGPVTPQRLKHIHHMAFRCRDAEQTRWFYEDVLGLPLAMAMVFDEEPGTARKVDYMHLFFQMGDGNFVAFFDTPDNLDEAMFKPRHGFDLHLAWEVDSLEELQAWRQRLIDAGVSCFGPVDHEFIHSLYFYDPNGLQCEITIRDVDYAGITAAESASAHQVLSEWTQKTRERKLRACSASALDRRGKAPDKVRHTGHNQPLPKHARTRS